MIKHNLNHLPSAALLITTYDADGNVDSITVMTPWEFTRGNLSDKEYLTNFGHLAIGMTWGETNKVVGNPASALFTGKSQPNETILVTSREMAINTYLELGKRAATTPRNKYVKAKFAA